LKIDIDITRQQEKLFIDEANRQWENLTGKIPFYYGEWIAIYTTICWKRFKEKVASN